MLVGVIIIAVLIVLVFVCLCLRNCMRDSSSWKKGDPLILLPDFYNKNNSLKEVFFLFQGETCDKRKYLILAEKKNDIDKYQNFEDFNKKRTSGEANTDAIIYETDYSLIKKYDKESYRKYKEVFRFINKKKPCLEKIIKWFSPLKEINIRNACYYKYIKKTYRLYCISFYILYYNFWTCRIYKTFNILSVYIYC